MRWGGDGIPTWYNVKIILSEVESSGGFYRE